MPQFAYRAKKGPKEILTGVIGADSEEQVINKLSEEGLLPISIEALSGASAGAVASAPGRKRFLSFGGVRSSEVTVFSRQLASLLKSGVPILRALSIIQEQCPNPRFRNILHAAEADIRDGKSLSSVLSNHPKIFPPVYIAMVRAGEDSGKLQESLLRIAVYRQKQEEIVSKVRMALAYPSLIALTGAGTIGFMLAFVVPKLTQLFSNMGEHLPLPTRILIAVSSALRHRETAMVLVAVVFLCIAVIRLKPAQVKSLLGRLSLGTPVIRDFVLKSELARAARSLELLIKSGIPILKGIEITAPVISNEVLRREFARSRDDLAGGGTLAASLRMSKHFPPFILNMISVGEESGKLDEAMEEIADFYERETEEAVKVVTSLMEPVMILFMGLIVGFIVIAMLLPMFELNMIVS